MLDDPRSDATLVGFHEQWLGIADVLSHPVDEALEESMEDASEPGQEQGGDDAGKSSDAEAGGEAESAPTQKRRRRVLTRGRRTTEEK